MPNLRFRATWRRLRASSSRCSCHNQSQSPLVKLPLELLILTTEMLPRVSWLCLALTCKYLWNTFLDSPIRPVTGAELNKLLWLLEVDSPRYISCFICQRLYPMKKPFRYTLNLRENLRTAQGGLKVSSNYEISDSFLRLLGLWLTRSFKEALTAPGHNVSSKGCIIRAGSLRTGFRTVVPFEIIHMIMRSWRISPEHGLPLKFIAGEWTNGQELVRKVKSRKRGKLSDIWGLPQQVKTSPKLVDGRLFLKIDYTFVIDFSQSDPLKYAGVGHPGCPHKHGPWHTVYPNHDTPLEWVCNTTIEHGKNLRTRYDGILSPCLCRHCSTNFRCLYCASEFKPFIKKIYHDSCTLILSVWKDIGSVEDPWSPLWIVNREESAVDATRVCGEWEKHSFRFEKLQDIYERGSPDKSKTSRDPPLFRYL